MCAVKKDPKGVGEKAAFMPTKAQKSQQPPREPEPRSALAPRRSCLHKQLRKTKFCMYHLQGVCEFGDSCAFAHSCVELQGAPDLRKTRLCKAFVNGNCKEANCLFAHNEEELRSTDLFYKKSLCMWYEKGRCRNGDQCRFAHGIAELQSWPLSSGDTGLQGIAELQSWSHSSGDPGLQGGAPSTNTGGPGPGTGASAGPGAAANNSGRRAGKSGGQGRNAGGKGGGGGGGRGAAGSSDQPVASAPTPTAAYAHSTAAAIAAAAASAASSAGEAAAAPPLPFGAGICNGTGLAMGSAGLGVGAGVESGIGLLPGASMGGSLLSGLGGPVQPPPGISDPRLLGERPSTRNSLEPMFVKTVPQLSALQDNLEQLTQQQRQMEQLQRSLAASVDSELVRRREREMQSLQNISTEVAAAAANSAMIEGARGSALQAELGMLTQNIANLSLRLKRFENQMPMRQYPQALQGASSVSQALLQQASALAQQALLVGANGQDTRADASSANINPYNLGNVASPAMSQWCGLNPGLFNHA